MDGTNRPWYKVWWVYLAFIAVVVAVTVGVLADGPADAPSTEDPPTDEAFIVEDDLFLNVYVEDVETGVTSFNEGLLSAEAEGAFTLVLLSVENDTDQPLAFNAEDVQGIDSSAQTLLPDSEATVLANERNEAGLFLEAVEPGESVTGLVVFDVPMDESLLAVVVPDWTSTEGREIPLYP